MSNIKILNFKLSGNFGGIESFLLNLAKCSDANDVQLDFISKNSNLTFEKEFEKIGCKIHKVPSDIFGYFREVKKLLNDYDIIHIHKNSAADIIFPLLAKRYGRARIIVHSHNTNPSTGGAAVKLLHMINRPILRKLADLCFACSDSAAKWLYGEKFAENSRIIKNGIIVEDYTFNREIREQIRHEFNLEDKFVIGHVGRFSRQKNHELLIDIFNEIYKSNKNARLMLVGDGELRGQLEEKVYRLGLSDKVIFCGVRDDVNRLYQAMDVFLFPSLYEGLPVAAVEAQAAGLYIIASSEIPQSADLTGCVKFMDLSEDCKKWADAVMEFCNYERKNTAADITKAGYDMKSTAILYKQLCEELLCNE
jgi:glycosyltransferase involved in cell wall biosynthesis